MCCLLGPPGGFWGSSGSHLGPSGAALGGLLRPFGTSGGRLACLVPRFWASGACWGHLWSSCGLLEPSSYGGPALRARRAREPLSLAVPLGGRLVHLGLLGGAWGAASWHLLGVYRRILGTLIGGPLGLVAPPRPQVLLLGGPWGFFGCLLKPSGLAWSLRVPLGAPWGGVLGASWVPGGSGGCLGHLGAVLPSSLRLW